MLDVGTGTGETARAALAVHHLGELEWLREAGFSVEVVWTEHDLAVVAADLR